MKKFPTHLQVNSMECGPCCLKIISEYYGIDISLSQLNDLAELSHAGTSFLSLAKTADLLGFNNMSVKISLQQLIDFQPFPCIVHWNSNHFVVVYKITASKVFISDPAFGLIEYSKREFVNNWMGKKFSFDDECGLTLILIQENPAQLTKNDLPTKYSIRQYLLEFIKPFKSKFIVLFCVLSIMLGIQMIVPYFSKELMDKGVLKHNINFVSLMLMFQLSLTLSQILFEFFRNRISFLMSSKLNINLISNFFDKLFNLPIKYFETRLTGDLLQRLRDYDRIQAFLTGSTIMSVFSILSLIIYGIILLIYSKLLFLIFVIFTIIYLVWVLLFMKKRAKLDYQRFQKLSKNNSAVLEIINGMQEIKLNNAETNKKWGWETNQYNLLNLFISSFNVEQLQNNGARIINESKNTIMILIAASMVVNGNSTVGTMLAVSFIIGQLSSPVNNLIQVIKSWQDTQLSFNRISEIQNLENEHTGLVPFPDFSNIYFSDISFKYQQSEHILLKNINLKIRRNSTVAIVGESGCGKSTLLKLFLRFHMPISGKISFDGININDIDLKQYRERIGIVMQEGYIYSDTIERNICLNNDDVDIDRLREVGEITNLNNLCDGLPSGYKTVIGNEGLNLSTGEKQRVLLARALYKDPQILFLDEATSSLDAINEATITEKISQLSVQKTLIIIAHRLSTVKNADVILVMRDGEISEYGTHDELLGNKGYYYKLVENQFNQ